MRQYSQSLSFRPRCENIYHYRRSFMFTNDLYTSKTSSCSKHSRDLVVMESSWIIIAAYTVKLVFVLSHYRDHARWQTTRNVNLFAESLLNLVILCIELTRNVAHVAIRHWCLTCFSCIRLHFLITRFQSDSYWSDLTSQSGNSKSLVYHGLAEHSAKSETERKGISHSNAVCIEAATLPPSSNWKLYLFRRGLDNAGKTTIVKMFMGSDVTEISPTLGFDIETFEYQSYARVWLVSLISRYDLLWIDIT